MPTGYTSALYDGKEQTFAEFVMQCARAFGACIEMRDDPWDKPIPDEFTSDDTYNIERLEVARKELAEIQAMTPAEIEKRAQEDYEAALTSHRESLERAAAIGLRYTAMLEQVNAWAPPTSDHNALKKFMVEQLTESIKHDCGGYQPEEPRKLKAQEWLNQRLKCCRSNIAYHLEAIERERQRVEFNNKWIRELRRSLAKGA